MELYEERKKIFEKLNKEVEKYYQKNPLEYTKYEILDYYKVLGDGYDGTLELEPTSNFKLSIEEDEKELKYVDIKLLPEHTRMHDYLVEVCDKENKQVKYYFCREQMLDWFMEEYDNLKDIFSDYQEGRV